MRLLLRCYRDAAFLCLSCVPAYVESNIYNMCFYKVCVMFQYIAGKRLGSSEIWSDIPPLLSARKIRRRISISFISLLISDDPKIFM